MSEKRWEAKKEEIEGPEFDETRRCLMNLYNSYLQTHAGYIIAVSIGLFALISSFDAFLKSGPVVFTLSVSNISSLEFTLGSLIFIALMVGIGIFSYYMIKRTFYWSYFASRALNMTLDEVIQTFNEFNSDLKTKTPYLKKPPHTAILQYALWFSYQLEHGEHKTSQKAKA